MICLSTTSKTKVEAAQDNLVYQKTGEPNRIISTGPWRYSMRDIEQNAKQTQYVFKGNYQRLDSTFLTGRLTIGCTNSVAVGLLPPVLGSLSKGHPDPQLIVRFKKTTLLSGEYIVFRRKGKANLEKLIVSRRKRREVDYFLRKFQKAKAKVQYELTSWEAIKSFVVNSDGSSPS